mmetsp:Transcript_29977/g.30465  ORF Transcript_29977/g.30465 Transcript_29977/m.30465 type:complete len:219 (-) Transcript_29977:1721-2377(-)
MVDEGNKDSVTISPEVFALLVAHAASHPTTTVHGVLIGNRSKSNNKVDVTDAFPICHENPTRPLVETALALVQSNLEEEETNNKYIVGWFTAPELLYETKPGPVALRIVASLAAASSSRNDPSSFSGEPVLLSLHNETIVNILAEKDSVASKVIQAYGKDFGMQWMEPLDLTVLNESVAVKAVTDIINGKVNINDLVDHWDKGASSEWTLASSLSSFT